MQDIEQRLGEYEGLIQSTARLMEGKIEGFGIDDIAQRLRIRVWRALLSFDAQKKNALPEPRYVFMCVTSERFDLLKRVRRGDLSLDNFAPASIVRRETTEAYAPLGRDGRSVLSTEDAGLRELEDPGVRLPSTLTPLERRVVYLLYIGSTETQIAAELDVTRGTVQVVVRSIRSKLEDWRPRPRPAHPLAGRPAPVEQRVAA